MGIIRFKHSPKQSDQISAHLRHLGSYDRWAKVSRLKKTGLTVDEAIKQVAGELALMNLRKELREIEARYAPQPVKKNLWDRFWDWIS